jgi:two-component system cell cycle sensor histidine kinase/response regulator CckA
MSADAAAIPGPDKLQISDGLLIAAALAASAAILWFVTREPLVVLGYSCGLLALGGIVWTLRRSGPVEQAAGLAMPDWSVTVAAIDRLDAGIAITDRAGRLVCANACYEAWFGISHAPPLLPVDEPSLERLSRAARAAWRDGTGAADLLDSPTGRWRAQAARSGRGEDFLVWHFIPIIAADLTAELSAQLEGNLGRALSQAGIAAAIVDPAGVISCASTGFAQRATGDSLAAVVGKEFVSFLLQEEADRFLWARDGRQGAPLTLYYLPLADAAGAGPGFSDPTESPSLLLLADAGAGLGGGGGEVSSAAPHLESLLAQLPLGLAMADRDGRLLFANAAFMRAALREGELPPTYPTDLVVQEDKGPLSDAIRRFGLGPVASGDIAVRLKDQPEEPVSLSLAGVRGLGEAAVLLGLTDTTVETRLKRQVAQATKMQAVGQLAGGVAHDFNNVLTAVLGTCDLMLMRHMPGDSDYDDIQQIRANSNRAASLTRQLLAFSRQQTLRPEVLQLPDVVSEVSQMLKRLIGEKIHFAVRHDRDLGPVRADPTQLEQVIVNLVVNARDAMQGQSGKIGGDSSGQLTLSTRRITPADVREMRTEVMPQGEYTALVVEDTGGGIAPEHLGKIWEPFFTTKEPGRGGNMGGTGLGLSTVYGVVKQSGGYIFADSELGKGTRFTVYLPVHHSTATPANRAELILNSPNGGGQPPLLPRREWAGGGRILLVEDEDPVRMVAERALVRSGYEVTPARDGEEGLELVQRGGEYDMVVSDVVMPSMDGPTMVREIRKIAPHMPVLFMSGYAEEQLRSQIGIDDVHFLPKPFSVQQLSDKVGAVLADTSSPA